MLLGIPGTINSQVILKLTAGKGGGVVEFSWPLDPISSRVEVVEKDMPEVGQMPADLAIKSCLSLQIRFRNSVQSLLVKPSIDTLELRFDSSLNIWNISSVKDEFYQSSVAIDSFVDQAMLDMGRPGSPGALRKASSLADSLRQKYLGSDACLRDYAHFTASFLENSSGRPANTKFVEKVFQGRMNAFLNPAFSAVFHSLFDDLMLIKGKMNVSENWIEAYHPANPSQSFLDWVRKQTGVQNDTLLHWILLNTVQELNHSGAVQKDDLLQLLNSSEKELNVSVMNELSGFLKARIQYSSRGVAFPDFSFKDAKTGTILSLNKLKNKPVYLVYLPNAENELLQNLFFLNGFYKKYGKEFQFLALVNRVSSESLAALAQKHGFLFFLAAFDDCQGFKTEALESTSNPAYVLIDRKGLIWQSPAESPETGVDAAFLALIHQ